MEVARRLPYSSAKAREDGAFLDELRECQASHEERVNRALATQADRIIDAIVGALEHLAASLVTESGKRESIHSFGQQTADSVESFRDQVAEPSSTSTVAHFSPARTSTEKLSALQPLRETAFEPSAGLMRTWAVEHNRSTLASNEEKVPSARFVSDTKIQSPSFFAEENRPLQKEKVPSARFMSDTKIQSPSFIAEENRPLQKVFVGLVQSSAFECVSALGVLTNSVLIGVQADFAMRHPNVPDPSYSKILDACFTVLFTCELICRMLAGRWHFFACSSKEFSWNMFDSILVIIGLLETFVWMLTDIMNLSFARLFRLLRMMRLLRVLRVFRFFKDLRIMVISIMSSVKPLVWALIVLFGTIYVVAIAFLQIMTLSDDAVLSKNVKMKFGTLPFSIYTLFASITGGVDWLEVSNTLSENSQLLVFMFILYLSFTVFCMLNIITGIFVENARTFSSQDEDLMLIAETEQRKRWIEEVRRLFNLADEDGSGYLDFEEFESAIQNMEVQVYLKHLGIDVLSASARFMFDLFDAEGKGIIDVDEFSDGLLRFNGSATSIDMAAMSHRVQHIVKQIGKVQDALEDFASGDLDPRTVRKKKPQTVVAPHVLKDHGSKAFQSERSIMIPKKSQVSRRSPAQPVPRYIRPPAEFPCTVPIVDEMEEA